jgi:hypothetical protein
MDQTLATPQPRAPAPGNGNYPEIPPDAEQTKAAATPPPAPPPPSKPEPLSITLRKPIRTHMSSTTTELVFREPTVADLERVGGSPVELDFSMGFPPRPVFQASKMTVMLSLLANVAHTSIQEMDVRDWTDAGWKIAPFFMPDIRLMI